jgi:PAS domain S-box-containing protein
MIAGTYHVGLVALSVLIAIVASYAAFDLGERVSASGRQRRWAWLTSGAIAMGFAIWSMHYVGMLAFVLPVPVLYHVPTVILSLAAAVIGAAIALYIVSKETMRWVDTAIAGVCLGGAIVSMHYVGMAAMRSAAMHHYRLGLVVLSVVVAVTFSSLAAWLAFKFGRSYQGFTWTKISAASLMGVGIASMHYTAMAAAYFMPGHAPPMRHTVEVSTLGAFGIGMTTLLLLSTVLVSLWFDRRLANARLLQHLYRDLQEREAKIRRLVDANIIGIYIWNLDKIVEANDAFLHILDYSRDDLVSGRLRWADLTPEEWRDRDAQALAEINATGTVQPYEKEYFRKDGGRVPVLIGVASFEETGKHGVAFVLDLAERKRAEERLHAAMSEQTRLAAFREEIGMALAGRGNLRAILHNCAEAMVRHLDAAFARIWTVSSDGRELELQASAGMYTHLDGSHSRIPVGHFKIGLIAQERKPHLINDVQNDPRVSDKDWARREKMTSFAGCPLVVEDRAVGVMGMFSQKPLTERTPETLLFVADGIAQGIERKRGEEELRAAESRFRTYVDHATDALFVHDEQLKVVDVNRRACENLGYSREELVGMPLRDFDSGVDAAFVESIGERLAVGETLEFETSHRRKDGTMFPVEVRVRPFWHGGQRFALSLARDITDRKRAEEERETLHQLQADLARINRVTTMGELTASLAHEINQPIAAAVTNARTCVRWLAREVPDIEEAREAATRTAKDATRAAEIINRIRALFKRGAPQRELVDINEIINEIALLIGNEAMRYAVSIRIVLARDLPQVAADRVQLQQVLMNLVMNSIEGMKAVERGRELTLSSQRNGPEQLRVSVSDTGVGLPPEGDQIFEAFFTTKPAGTGMGLTISRSIIESHGGRLWATANAGAGVTFHFTLPTTLEAQP